MTKRERSETEDDMVAISESSARTGEEFSRTNRFARALPDLTAKLRAEGQRGPLIEAARAFQQFIDESSPGSLHILIACSKTKGFSRSRARDMYTSPLFRKSLKYAENTGIDFHILSAKHGLLHAEQEIDTYDFALSEQTAGFKEAWGQQVYSSMLSSIGRGEKVILFAGSDYCDPLVRSNAQKWHELILPMAGLSLGRRLSFLNMLLRLHERKKDVNSLYSSLSEISRRNGIYRFSDILRDKIANQGVYFIFDENEATRFSNEMPRIVRIGTHGVSSGSRASLRTRLRTHVGTSSGSGNHRGSVFRLHVGRAILRREKDDIRYPDWGKGQSTTTICRQQELPLEKMVSSYIGRLFVTYLPIEDRSAKTSLRALVESECIRLLTEDFLAPDRPSKQWLGLFSDKTAIRISGLWNVRDVGLPSSRKFMPFLKALVEKRLAE